MRLGLGSVVACGILLLLAAVLAPAGCSNQPEGERCKFFKSTDNSVNGTDDCRDGLVCTEGTSLISHPNYDACCPPDCRLATTYICACPTGQLEMDAGFNRDSEVDGPDGAADVGSDGPSADAASEAPADAPAETDAPNDAPNDTSSDAEGG